jgi:hypothetical protein
LVISITTLGLTASQTDLKLKFQANTPILEQTNLSNGVVKKDGRKEQTLVE